MCASKVAVVTDSSTYFPEEMMRGLNIHVIPLWMIWDEDKLRDGVDISPQEFYTRLRGSKTMPTSSQPSAGEFMAFFKQVAQDNDAIAAVLVSSKISGTVASACAAQEQLPEIPIRVVDTLTVSMGLGYCVLEAAKAAKAGKSLGEVAAVAEQMSQRVHFLFAVDTLEYLYKGGRIGGAKALLGTALSIKPLLHFKDGQIEPLMQVRTKKKSIATMLDVAEERLGGKRMLEATVLHVDVPEEGEAVAEMVRQRFPGVELVCTTVGPVVGTHAGIGSVGLVFYGEE